MGETRVAWSLDFHARLIRTTTGWRPVLRRGRRAGRRVCKQQTSLSVSTSPSCREWQIPAIVGRRVSVERQPAASVCNGHRRMPATRRRHRRTSLNRQSVLRKVPLCRRAGQQVDTGVSDVTSVSAVQQLSAVVVRAERCGVDETTRRRAQIENS